MLSEEIILNDVNAHQSYAKDSHCNIRHMHGKCITVANNVVLEQQSTKSFIIHSSMLTNINRLYPHNAMCLSSPL